MKLTMLPLAGLLAVAATGAAAQPALPQRGPEPPQAREDGYATPGRPDEYRPRLSVCRADIQALCGATEGRQGGRMRCLAENRDKVSPGCAAVIDEIARNRAERTQSGRGWQRDRGDAGAGGMGLRGADRDPGAPGSNGRMAGRDPGSEDRALGAQEPRRGGPLAACRLDVATFCGNEASGGRQRAQCLRQHANELSLDCNAALAQLQSARQAARRACRTDVRELCEDAGRGGVMSCLRERRNEVSPECGDALSALPFMARAEPSRRRFGPDAGPMMQNNPGDEEEMGPRARK